MLKVLDFEALDDPEPTYRFTVEAVDEEGVMPPGLTSVTVTIKVGVWKHFFFFLILVCNWFKFFDSNLLKCSVLNNPSKTSTY